MKFGHFRRNFGQVEERLAAATAENKELKVQLFEASNGAGARGGGKYAAELPLGAGALAVAGALLLWTSLTQARIK